MEKSLETFQNIAKSLLEDESKNPVAEHIPSDQLYSRLDLSLHNDPIDEEKFQKALKDQFVLRNIFFQLGVADLLSYDDTIRGLINPKHIYIQLDSLAVAIKKDGGTFEIQNHTDCRGSDHCCYRLSDARAKTVMQYLISKGVSEEKLSFKGFEGDVPRVYYGKPLTCNYILGLDSPEEKEKMHQLNRRVVVKRVHL